MTSSFSVSRFRSGVVVVVVVAVVVIDDEFDFPKDVVNDKRLAVGDVEVDVTDDEVTSIPDCKEG